MNCIDLYRFGFNGKEKDDEWTGSTGATYDYGFRIYDSRIARFLSVDPLFQSYPWYSPYQFAGNMPIAAIDLDGLEEYLVINVYNELDKLVSSKIRVVYDSSGKICKANYSTEGNIQTLHIKSGIKPYSTYSDAFTKEQEEALTRLVNVSVNTDYKQRNGSRFISDATVKEAKIKIPSSIETPKKEYVEDDEIITRYYPSGYHGKSDWAKKYHDDTRELVYGLIDDYVKTKEIEVLEFTLDEEIAGGDNMRKEFEKGLEKDIENKYGFDVWIKHDKTERDFSIVANPKK